MLFRIKLCTKPIFRIIFIFLKLTEVCRFVTYLWDDPRISCSNLQIFSFFMTSISAKEWISGDQSKLCHNVGLRYISSRTLLTHSLLHVIKNTSYFYFLSICHCNQFPTQRHNTTADGGFAHSTVWQSVDVWKLRHETWTPRIHRTTDVIVPRTPSGSYATVQSYMLCHIISQLHMLLCVSNHVTTKTSNTVTTHHSLCFYLLISITTISGFYTTTSRGNPSEPPIQIKWPPKMKTKLLVSLKFRIQCTYFSVWIHGM